MQSPRLETVGPGAEVGAEVRQITRRLRDWNQGDQEAMHQVVTLLYGELRAVAGHFLKSESPQHTLSPTALINEAYLRLFSGKKMVFESRAQFFWFAGQLMRRILVDHARYKGARKRGDLGPGISLDGSQEAAFYSEVDIHAVISLDQALERLAAVDPRQSHIVELRFFCGLEVVEIADILGLSPTTIKREWQMAKHWLARELGPRSPIGAKAPAVAGIVGF